MWTRRRLITSALAAAGAALWPHGGARANEPRKSLPGSVETPDVSKAPWTLNAGVKEFHLVAEPVEREFAPGFRLKCWGYNGQTPGPTIEAVQGDRVRILVTNKLPEHTTIHWHGLILPNGMDGVGGLNQPHIKPGETYAYEFTLKQHGTFMYHPHADEMVQMAMGMMGLFIVHPEVQHESQPDRDFALMLHEWSVHPGTYRADPSVMLDFNHFSFNGKVFPATSPLVVRTGQNVRIRLGNLSMNQHPIHLHGHTFKVVATDGGTIPTAGRWPQTTVPVPVGSTRDIEFVATEPGDWVLHCHKSHHTMNAMGHGLPNALGADLGASETKIRKLLPDYMAMGEKGMAEMQEMAEHMQGPENTLPMMGGMGPFGPLEMGGMFTLLKVRDHLHDYSDPGWYEQPQGTRAYKL